MDYTRPRPLTVSVLAVVLVALTAVGPVPAQKTPAQKTSAPKAAGLAGLKPGAAAGFNLLLITLDTTRADRLGSYGDADAVTPVLDRLAAEGVRFAQAVTPVPVTLPAHSSLMTGLYPPRHGVRHNAEFRLGEEHTTLAETLTKRGFDTAAFVSAFVLDRRFGLAQGFDTYDDQVAAEGSGFPQGTPERSAEAVTDEALVWLGQRTADGPRFFAWVHYFDPHAPYAPPAAVNRHFPGRPYEGEIAYVDQNVGRLIAMLEAKKLAARTVVIVAADHGEGLGEHGERTHALFVYDSVMRVPLILWAPGLGVRGAVVDDRVVSLVDVAPTALSLLGVEDGVARDGVDLLRASADPGREVYLESMPPYLDYGWAPLTALRRLDDKYILAPRPEYYDVGADPDESENLAASTQASVRRARETLASALAAKLDQWPGLADLAAGGGGENAETLAQLRALGYLGGAGPAGDDEPLADPKDMAHVVSALIDLNAHLAAGRPVEALAIGREAYRASPRDRSVLHALAKVFLRLDRPRDAEKALVRFNEIKPNADTLLLQAQIQIADGRREEAGQLLDQAAALDPRHGGVFIARGDLLALSGRREEAMAAYRRAGEVDPYRARGLAEARTTALKAGDLPGTEPN